MKGVIPLILVMNLFTLTETWLHLERAKRELKGLRDELAGANKKSDILFLLDTTGRLSPYDFQTVKEFVMNFLNTVTVSAETTRVEVIPFADTASRYIDGVSSPSKDKHKCHLVEKLKHMPQSINGYYMRNTYDAFKLAFDVCLGQLSGNKRGPLSLVKTVVILLMFGHWYGQSPVSIAKNLQQANIEVFVIGIENNFPDILHHMVNNAQKQAFDLGSFQQLRELSVFLRGGE